MFSLGKTVFFWAADSASILLDLANAGRDADNGFVLAIAAGLAVARFGALLLFTLPALAWLYTLIFRRVKKEDAALRAILAILIVASVLFEIWVTPTRLADAGSEEAAIAEQAEGDGGA